MTDRRLVAALACRNAGSRLYGKPLQNLDIDTGYTVLDALLAALESLPAIDEIVLGIAEGAENDVFAEIAVQKRLRFIRGNETDVLGRLIACGDLSGATDVFRVTSESPFPYLDAVEPSWAAYCDSNLDAYFFDEIVDGCGFEILSLDALKISHSDGEDRHRSELCSLYIRENSSKFRVRRAHAPPELHRTDLRLTVDYPEDLVVCRAVYQAFRETAPRIPISEVVQFLDANASLKALIEPLTAAGYSTMYIWSGETEIDN